MRRTVNFDSYSCWMHNDRLRQLASLVIQEIVRARPDLFLISRLVFDLNIIDEKIADKKSFVMLKQGDDEIVYEDWHGYDPLGRDYIVVDASKYMDITLMWEDK